MGRSTDAPLRATPPQSVRRAACSATSSTGLSGRRGGPERRWGRSGARPRIDDSRLPLGRRSSCRSGRRRRACAPSLRPSERSLRPSGRPRRPSGRPRRGVDPVSGRGLDPRWRHCSDDGRHCGRRPEQNRRLADLLNHRRGCDLGVRRQRDLNVRRHRDQDAVHGRCEAGADSRSLLEARPQTRRTPAASSGEGSS